MKIGALLFALVFTFCPVVLGGVISGIDERYEKASIMMADQIWQHAELGYQEAKSSRLLFAS